MEHSVRLKPQPTYNLQLEEKAENQPLISCGSMLSFPLLVTLAAAALRAPSSRPADVETGRRAVLHGGATVALLPLFALPNCVAAAQLGAATSVEEGNELATGFSGALRTNIGPSVLGDGVEILVTDLSYKELGSCPSDFFVPAKGGPWTCLEITATALNQVQRPSTVLDACLWRTVLQPSSQLSSSHARSQGRRKKPEAADIFGFLFDAEGFACVSTALDPTTKGSPIATLTMPFPQGQKTPIKFVAAVQSRSPRPFRFAAFKGNYRSASVAKTFQTFDPCEIDSSKCDDFLEQPENAKAGGAALYKN